MEISIIFKSFVNKQQVTALANKTEIKELPEPEKTQQETFDQNEFIN